MSLYGSIQMAGNTLQAMQIGLHVVGNNIANANTPGYIRERTLFTPAPVQRLGALTLGLGVEVAGIVQSIDKFAEQRLRDTGSDRASAEIQEKIYGDLEAILGELQDGTDVSSLMSNFFGSIGNVAAQPEVTAARSLVVEAGKTLTASINSLNRRVQTVYEDFGTQVTNLAAEINALSEQIRKLNLQIVSLEGGSASPTEAGGLRSQRQAALRRMAEIADIQVSESPIGAINVSVSGEFLVFEGTRQEVVTKVAGQDGLSATTVVFKENQSQLRVTGGELHGIFESRDRIVSGFLDRLDEFAGALAFEFNKIYSQGLGMTGFSSLTSVEAVRDPNASLDAAGLPFTPNGGAFDLIVYNTQAQQKKTHSIKIDLNGLDGDTSLADLAAAIDAVEGVSASITNENRLRIRSDTEDLTFGFSGDTSGVLAAIGINTFFTGSGAGTIGINETLRDATKFAAATGELGVGVENAIRLVDLHDSGVGALGGVSIVGAYDQLVNETAQGATVAASLAEGFRVFEQTLISAAEAASGVNLDEEAIDMIMLQRTYQASARYIATLTELLDILVGL